MTDLFIDEDDDRVPFSVLAARAPAHDPSTCRREPCSRCRPKATPRTPDPIDRQVRGPVPLAKIRTVDPDKLTDALTEALRTWRPLGASTIDRFAAWQQPRLPDTGERGGGDGGTAAIDTIKDRIENSQATRYAHELATLTQRIHADLARLTTLVQIAHPDQPRVLRHSDMTATQLIADGWCPSCFRDDGYLEPITPNRYRDRCRRCGDFRAASGKDPSVDELRIMHSRGKRLRHRSA